MSAWTRSPSYGGSICVERPPHTWAIPTIALDPTEMVEEQAQGPTRPYLPAPMKLNQIFYTPRSINPSCFQVPQPRGDVQFSFISQYRTMFPKLSRDGDAYYS